MPVQDLREWIKKMKTINGIKIVNGANWEEEIGVITDLYQRNPGSPALLFDEIPGYGWHGFLRRVTVDYGRVMA